MLVTFLAGAGLNGHLQQFVFTQIPAVINNGLHILYLMLGISGLLFTRAFLGTQQILPRVDRALRVLICIYLAGIALRLAGVWTIPFLLSYFAIASLVGMVFLGAAAYRRGILYARWFVGAWLLYTGMLTVVILQAIGLFSVLGMGLMFGIVQGMNLLEILMIAIAQADRVRVLQRERQRSEENYREALERQNETLERLVTERSRDLETEREDAVVRAETDELTGIGNRRYIMDRAKRALTRSQGGSCQALAYLDPDKFKRINDEYGHEVGDRVIRHLARLLQDSVKPDDIVARFGGEEFVIFLPRVADAQDVHRIIERIRKGFQDRHTPARGKALRHTLSAGIALREPGEAIGLRRLLSQADKALYAAKHCGRNRTVMYDDTLRNSDTYTLQQPGDTPHAQVSVELPQPSDGGVGRS